MRQARGRLCCGSRLWGEFVQKLTQVIPMGRMGVSDEYKAAVLSVVSDASSYLTGANLCESCALVYILGRRVYRLEFEWPRLVKLASVLIGAYFVSSTIPLSFDFWQSVALKFVILAAVHTDAAYDLLLLSD